jgi:deoxyribonuclease V
MILAVDAAYKREKAFVGGILFRNWTDENPLHETVISLPVPDIYIPGRFYRRELPSIENLL